MSTAYMYMYSAWHEVLHPHVHVHVHVHPHVHVHVHVHVHICVPFAETLKLCHPMPSRRTTSWCVVYGHVSTEEGE